LREQALHAIGTGFSCLFSRVTTHFCVPVRSGCRCRVGQSSATRLPTGKAWGKTRVQAEKLLCPTTDIGGGGSGSDTGDMLFLLHELLLAREISESYIHLFRVSHASEQFMKLFHSQ
jgi:hypothetical protein